jgi:CRP/FNR family transcriptional regulator, cyclic AMP receptor protein
MHFNAQIRRKLGFIEYNGRIKIHKSLLNAVLLDQMPERDPKNSIDSASPRSGE